MEERPRFVLPTVARMTPTEFRESIAWGIVRGLFYYTIICAALVGAFYFVRWAIPWTLETTATYTDDAEYRSRREEAARRANPPVGSNYLNPQGR